MEIFGNFGAASAFNQAGQDFNEVQQGNNGAAHEFNVEGQDPRHVHTPTAQQWAQQEADAADAARQNSAERQEQYREPGLDFQRNICVEENQEKNCGGEDQAQPEAQGKACRPLTAPWL